MITSRSKRQGTATSNGGLMINIERYAGAKELPLKDVLDASKRKPGIYTDMSREEYDLLPFWNQSLLKEAIDSLAALQWRLDNPKASAYLDFGRAYHYAMLEPIEFPKQVMVVPKVDRRTKEGKRDWHAFEIASAGKILVNSEEYSQIERMAGHFRSSEEAMRLFGRGSVQEVALVWVDPATKLVMKGLVDQYIEDAWPTLADIKTTKNADPEHFGREMLNFNYDFQAATYCGGAKVLVPDKPMPNFVIVACQSVLNTPGLCSVHRVGKATMKRGWIRMRGVLDRVAEAIRKDEWPGYEDKVHDTDVPEFALRGYKSEE